MKSFGIIDREGRHLLELDVDNELKVMAIFSEIEDAHRVLYKFGFDKQGFRVIELKPLEKKV
ncbi:hypothetical protein VH12019_00019 [Vibrio phage VH1_2019]|nr:hypothetical protein pp2_160 [Vibrio phage phi-pp2]QHJ74346.1 hypothetical protein VH12019_00019 [Vibrio phage VH1_2019]QIW90874.1 hypothetical protein COHAPHLL_00011 [Vibrio phage V09]